jgi:hypothetical protein
MASAPRPGPPLRQLANCRRRQNYLRQSSVARHRASGVVGANGWTELPPRKLARLPDRSVSMTTRSILAGEQVGGLAQGFKAADRPFADPNAVTTASPRCVAGLMKVSPMQAPVGSLPTGSRCLVTFSARANAMPPCDRRVRRHHGRPPLPSWTAFTRGIIGGTLPAREFALGRRSALPRPAAILSKVREPGIEPCGGIPNGRSAHAKG